MAYEVRPCVETQNTSAGEKVQGFTRLVGFVCLTGNPVIGVSLPL